jgi:hypothetical protein
LTAARSGKGIVTPACSREWYGTQEMLTSMSSDYRAKDGVLLKGGLGRSARLPVEDREKSKEDMARDSMVMGYIISVDDR